MKNFGEKTLNAKDIHVILLNYLPTPGLLDESGKHQGALVWEK